MNATEFGEYLRTIRKNKKMTIRQLELYSGVSNAYLSHIENGKRGIPSPEILKKISKPLDVDYEVLMAAAGYIDKPSMIEWPKLADTMIRLNKYPGFDTYLELFKCLFEMLEFFYTHEVIKEDSVNRIINEGNKVNILIDQDKIKKHPYSTYLEIIKETEDRLINNDNYNAPKQINHVVSEEPAIYVSYRHGKKSIELEDEDEMEHLERELEQFRAWKEKKRREREQQNE